MSDLRLARRPGNVGINELLMAGLIADHDIREDGTLSETLRLIAEREFYLLQDVIPRRRRRQTSRIVENLNELNSPRITPRENIQISYTSPRTTNTPRENTQISYTSPRTTNPPTPRSYTENIRENIPRNYTTNYTSSRTNEDIISRENTPRNYPSPENIPTINFNIFPSIQKSDMSTQTLSEISQNQRDSSKSNECINLQCCICYNKERKYAFSPCYHFCVCENCVLYLRRCPLCRKTIEETHRIWL